MVNDTGLDYFITINVNTVVNIIANGTEVYTYK